MDKARLRTLLEKKKNKLNNVFYLNEIRQSYDLSKPNIHDKVKYLQSLPQHTQRSESWFKARKVLITASEAASVLFKTVSATKNYTDFYGITDFDINPSKGCNPYMTLNDFYLKKCGEIPFTGNIATRHGVKYEEVATCIYSRVFEKKILEFGLIQHPKLHWLGASPDGISAKEGIMLEIKCPFKRKITGICPFYYWVQVQLQLEVCNLDYCDFLECIFDKDFEWKSMKEFLDEPVVGFDNNLVFNKFGSNKHDFNKQTLEKGLIVLQRPRKEKGYELDTFYYPPVELTDPIELLDWAYLKIRDIKAALTIQNAWIRYKTGKYLHNFIIRPLPWKLEDIHVSRIPRDQEWFNSNKHILFSAFEKMQWFQKNGTKTIQKKKRICKKESPLISKFLILDSD